MNLEILIPLRNPTEVLDQTVQSLAAQTDRAFSVLISDNFSTQGLAWIDRAAAQLQAAGIPVRRVRPPAELGRVEHWNWLHYQSGAEWLKPLFGGDWLEPDYLAAVRAVVTGTPQCAYVCSAFQYHRGEETSGGISKWAGRFCPPAEMQELVLRFGMQFGPPSAAAYRREAFLGSGGYDPALPICADSLFFCKLAARHGAYGLPRACVHFRLHAARFSSSLPEKQRATFRETLRYYAELGLTAWHERWRFPVGGHARLFLREMRGRLLKK